MNDVGIGLRIFAVSQHCGEDFWPYCLLHRGCQAVLPPPKTSQVLTEAHFLTPSSSAHLHFTQYRKEWKYHLISMYLCPYTF